MSNLIAATTILVNLSVATQKIASVIRLAQTEGRDLSEEEIDKINSSYVNSFIELDEAISKKENENG